MIAQCFIQLYLTATTPILIDVRRIEVVSPKSTLRTSILLESGKAVTVEESYENVIKKMKQCEGKK